MRCALAIALTFPFASVLPAQIDVPTRPRERDYYAWITQVVTAPHALIEPRDDTTNSRRFRMVVLTSEIYSTAILEEVRFGPEGCCARVSSAREIDLDSLARRFGHQGELAGLTVVDALSPTSFRVRFKGRAFDLTNVDRPRIRVAEIPQ